MNSKTLHVLLIAAAFTSLVACETPMTSSEKNFGKAARHNTEQMIASGHTADGTPREPTPLDGPTAAGVAENYHENEQAEAQKTRSKRAGFVRIDDTK